jgi:hypothetical protein
MVPAKRELAGAPVATVPTSTSPYPPPGSADQSLRSPPRRIGDLVRLTFPQETAASAAEQLMGAISYYQACTAGAAVAWQVSALLQGARSLWLWPAIRSVGPRVLRVSNADDSHRYGSSKVTNVLVKRIVRLSAFTPHHTPPDAVDQACTQGESPTMIRRSVTATAADALAAADVFEPPPRHRRHR